MKIPILVALGCAFLVGCSSSGPNDIDLQVLKGATEIHENQKLPGNSSQRVYLVHHPLAEVHQMLSEDPLFKDRFNCQSVTIAEMCTALDRNARPRLGLMITGCKVDENMNPQPGSEAEWTTISVIKSSSQ